MHLWRAGAMALALVAVVGGRADAASCPAPASLAVLADNASGGSPVTIEVEGQLLDPAATCTGDGATTYAATLVCAGAGVTRCGGVEGLRPGAWVHRVRLQVPDSEEQVQRQRGVLLAEGSGVSNVVSWTLYPRAFVVRAPDGEQLRARLDAAEAFTAANPGARALVTFDPAAFPGADTPRLIALGFTPRTDTTDVCAAADVCADGSKAAHCLDGSRVVVDGLDALGRPGGVVVSVGRCAQTVFRVTGADTVLRGLELVGSQKIGGNLAVETLGFGGPGAQRSRVEQCIVRGSTEGDGVSVEAGAGSPAGPEHDIVITGTRIAGAAQRGLKVATGGRAAVVDSCLHDNREGGIQVISGGDVTALRTVIQANRLGRSHGVQVGVEKQSGPRNTLETDGNVVRFSGARGVSIVNAADASLTHDVLSENQQIGARVAADVEDAAPVARLRGVGLTCNYKRATGECAAAPSRVCARDQDCDSGACVYPAAGEPAGVGVALAAECVLCPPPVLDLGTGGDDTGRNAIAFNRNPLGFGDNLRNPAFARWTIPAVGNQWERCGPDPACNVAAVLARDVQPPIAQALTLGTPTGPRAGPAPAIVRIVPPRPRAGDFVRVYNGSLSNTGGTFNAIDAAACTAQGATPDGQPLGLPSDPCAPESPHVVAANRAMSVGNRVTITIAGETLDADVHAVTPTMLIFRMPVDCFAAATLRVTRGNDAPSAAVPFCDPSACEDRPAGTPCDDGDACTVGDACNGQDLCIGGPPLTCGSPCLTGACDREVGCVVAATDPMCDDGDPCTADRCVAAATCQNVPLAEGAACPERDRCHGPATCRAGLCDGGPAIACNDGDFCTDDNCDPVLGCRFAPVAGVRRGSCRVDELRGLLATAPPDARRIARQLGRRLDRADRALDRAERATRPGRMRAATKKARRELRAFAGEVRGARRALGRTLARDLTRSAKTAVDDLTAFLS